MKPYLLACCLLAGAPVWGAETQPPYLDPSQPLEKRVDDLLSRLTLDEKISLIHVNSKFGTAGVPRLGIPDRWMDDGPHGVREDVELHSWRSAGRTDDFCTAMPVCICLSATWDPDLARAYGEAIGQEARERGKDIMFAPVINIVRTPLGGRICEYFSEDPWLTSRMADAYIQGEQSQDVASCAVIFALNNQEYERGTINVELDDRALHEIYFPGFKSAVQEAGVWTVMAAYNQVRGQHCAESDFLLKQTLKGQWGFQGLVVSDYGATHDTRKAALNGLDLENGDPQQSTKTYLFAEPYLALLKSGELPMSGLDEKVRRNLRVMIATHVFDPGRANGSLNTPAHEAIARRTAEEGVVLLKNENHALPLDPAKIKTIAVIGENAVRLHSGGGNSFGLKPFYEITPLQGILNRVGSNVNITFAEGYRKNGTNFLADRAVAAAKAADVVIYIGGLNHDLHFDSEGADRRDLKLPYGQDELIQKIVAVNPRTIVVLEGMMVEMDAWLDRVPAVVEAWYPGMEGGNALAGVLFGDANPSGKLPVTFPKKLADTPQAAFGPTAYPGVNGTVTYAEGLLVGYRWYDTKHIEPLFPFGFGLSYTTFAYSNLKLVPDASGVTAQFDIKNTGAVAGAEVAELYVHAQNSSVSRPDKELKGFQRVFLKPGETQTVFIPLKPGAFSFYRPDDKSWVAEKGDYQILVGGSSRDLPLQGDYSLAATVVEKD